MCCNYKTEEMGPMDSSWPYNSTALSLNAQ
jgi:hypothetical protein